MRSRIRRPSRRIRSSAASPSRRRSCSAHRIFTGRLRVARQHRTQRPQPWPPCRSSAEAEVVAAIGAGRFRVGPARRRAASLPGTFADQAAIAMENARLFNETKDALGRQTAAGEILRVISGSPDRHPSQCSTPSRRTRCALPVGPRTRRYGSSRTSFCVCVHASRVQETQSPDLPSLPRRSPGERSSNAGRSWIRRPRQRTIRTAPPYVAYH